MKIYVAVARLKLPDDVPWVVTDNKSNRGWLQDAYVVVSSEDKL